MRLRKVNAKATADPSTRLACNPTDCTPNFAQDDIDFDTASFDECVLCDRARLDGDDGCGNHSGWSWRRQGGRIETAGIVAALGNRSASGQSWTVLLRIGRRRCGVVHIRRNADEVDLVVTR